jgi:hypothetical protein
MRIVHALASVLLIAVLASPAMAQQIGGEIGNLNDPVDSVPNILLGDQSLAYLVFPGEQVSCPDDGFRLDAVRIWLEFSEDQVPVCLSVSGGLLDAVPEGDGFVPGDPIYLSEPRLIAINDPGLQVIEVFTDDVASCEILENAYFLALRFLGPAEASLGVDDEPAPGIEFIDSGQGYVDLNGFDRPSGGKIIIWGDIICCITTPTERSSWHQIKQLFR